jgi:hypothetical protein
MPSASGFFTYGQTTVGTSQVQLTSTSYKAVFGVVLKADNDNTGSVYVGLTGLGATTGFRLKAGEGITIEVDDPSKIYVIASAAAQTVHWVAV